MNAPLCVEMLLVQNDSQESLELRQTFQETGFVNITQIVPDAVTALACLHGIPPYEGRLEPALILVDLSTVDGESSLTLDLELLSELKSDAHLRAIPVVILTNNSRAADVLNVYSHGACSFVSKPSDPAERRELIYQFAKYWAQVAQLPCTVDRRSDEPWLRDHFEVDQHAAINIPTGSMKTVEVLVVDDSDDDVVLLKEAFNKCPMVKFVQTAEDGEAALRYLRRQGPFKNAKRPGLVLLDINMPKKNGFEVLAEMRADPKLSNVPVVILTTSKQESDILRAYASGACSFIAKPVNFEKMQQIAQQFAIYWTRVAAIPQDE